jgi:group I intron endonuclease
MYKKEVGIYKIFFTHNPDMLYIGSSINVRKRIAEHKRNLKKGISHNRKLQNSYNKYKENLKIEIIEFCTEEEVRKREQFWIDYFKSYERRKGFNLTQIVESVSGGYIYTEKQKTARRLHLEQFWKKNQKTYEFISPDGEYKKILGLNSFCKQNKLNTRKMYAVHSKKRIEYNGWKKYYSDGFLDPRFKDSRFLTCKPFKLKTPNGDIIEGSNLKKFCRENNLVYITIYEGACSRGYKRIDL